MLLLERLPRKHETSKAEDPPTCGPDLAEGPHHHEHSPRPPGRSEGTGRLRLSPPDVIGSLY